jgi:hypothetical protein
MGNDQERRPAAAETLGAQPLVIACSLNAEGLENRVEEWQSFMASSVRAVEWDDTSVRLELEPSDATLLRATSLGQREKACCAFFTVSIDLAADARTLTLRVPDGAEEVLAAFVASLRS